MAKKPAKHRHSLANSPAIEGTVEERPDNAEPGESIGGFAPAPAPGPDGKLAIGETKHIGELKPFRRQVRRHTKRNLDMIGESIAEVGWARPIVIDELGEIMAGAGATEAAGDVGLTNVRVIDADGTEIIAIRRSGLTDVQKLKLALYDNRAAEFAEYDLAAMREALKQPGIEPKKFFNDAELRQLEDRELAHEMGKAGDKSAKETVPSIPEGYTSFSVVVSNDAHTEIRSVLEEVKERTGLKTIAEALLVICRAYDRTRQQEGQ